MNYLTMCQDVRRRCGIAGTGPITVVDQVGVLGDIVALVKDAWIEIQSARSQWLFKWDKFSFQTVAGTQRYFSQIGDLRYWGSPITSYLNSQSDEYELIKLEYDEFYDRYLIGDANQDKPTHYAITPDNYLALAYIPDNAYTIQGPYYKDIQTLSADADVITLNDRYIMVITWLAVKNWAMLYESSSKFETASAEYAKWFNLLCREQLPNIDFGPPLV